MMKNLAEMQNQYFGYIVITTLLLQLLLAKILAHNTIHRLL